MCKLRCYLSNSGRNEVQNWYLDELSRRQHIKLHAVLETINGDKKSHWPHKLLRKDARKGYELYEIRVDCGVALRIFGYFDKDETEFVMTNAVTHKDHRGDSKAEFDKAQHRKELSEGDESRKADFIL